MHCATPCSICRYRLRQSSACAVGFCRNSNDSAKQFIKPILDAWGIDYRLIESAADKPQLAEFLAKCLAAQRPGVVLLAEGKG